MKEFVRRTVCFIGLLIGISVFPWWVVGILCLVFSFWFDNFFEIIVIGIVYDVTFHTPGTHWYLWGIHTVAAVMVYVIMIIIQKNTRKPEPLL